MRAVAAAATQSEETTAVERYIDREITTDEYFREVREEVAAEVDRELAEVTESDDEAAA